MACRYASLHEDLKSAALSASARRPGYTCHYLGVPKAVKEDPQFQALVMSDGSVVTHQLCARVDGSKWICLPGPMPNVRAGATGLLDPCALIERDVVRDAVVEHPEKRLRLMSKRATSIQEL